MKPDSRLKGIFLLLGLSAFAGCSGYNVPDDAFAQVAGSVLTLENLNRQFPREYQHLISRKQYLD